MDGTTVGACTDFVELNAFAKVLAKEID